MFPITSNGLKREEDGNDRRKSKIKNQNAKIQSKNQKDVAMNEREGHEKKKPGVRSLSIDY